MRTEAQVRKARNQMMRDVADAKRMIEQELRKEHPDFVVIESGHRYCANRRISINLLGWVLGIIDEDPA